VEHAAGPDGLTVAPPGRPGEVASSTTKHCAVLFADLVGYSTLMSRDELGTLEFMVACSDLVEELGARHGGRLVQTTGDGYLVLFDRCLGAVEFGVELHRLISKRQAGAPVQARFRIGIHVGDVHNVNGSIYGHAVNVAARIQAEALPGTCVLSEPAYHDVAKACDHPFESIGRPALKNISEQIPLYMIPDPGNGARAPQTEIALVTMVGKLTLRTAQGELIFPAIRKFSGLFAYLALSEGRRQRHEKMSSLLWPEKPKGDSRAFGACRRKLMRVLADDLKDLVVSGDGYLGLNELHFDIDLGVAEREIRRGRVPSLLLRTPDWPNQILEGFESLSPVFAGWLTVIRASWRERILTGLSDLLDNTAAADDLCRDAALAITAIDPGNEAAATGLIRYYGLRQNRAAALGEYARLDSYLRTRHGLTPGARVNEALRVAREGAAPEPAPPHPAPPHPAPPHPAPPHPAPPDPAPPDPAPPRPAPQSAAVSARPHQVARLLRIEVGTFKGQISGDSYVIAGFRNELLANLARFREWSVGDAEDLGIDRGTDRAPGQYAVSGTYLATPAGPHLRVKLSDNSNRVVWSDEFTISLQDWSALQCTIVGRIASHLETYISADRLHRVVGGSGRDVMSHDDWLRAEQIFSRWTPEAADEAETMLLRIIDRDDGFAPAYSSLASFRNVQHVVRPGLPRDAAGARRAHAYAGRAVEIDPLDARNHLAVAWTAALTDGFDRAAIHFDLAAGLNPNSATTLVSCAMGYAFVGQPDRAQTLVAHVQRISPLLSDYQWCYVASVHFLSGRFDEALRAARLSGDRIVDNPGWTAATLVRLGRTEEARRDFERLIDAVRPVWAGDGSPTAEAVLDWFTGAYPLRRPEDRTALNDALITAMRGQ